MVQAITTKNISRAKNMSTSLFPPNTVIKGRNFEYIISGWDKDDIDYFNKCVSALGNFYTTESLLSRLNPYLKPDEKLKAQSDVDNDYMQMFIKMFIGKIPQQNIIELGRNIMNDNNLGLKNGAERYLSTEACKLYIENASKLEDVLKKIIREEDIISEKQSILNNIKNEYRAETDSDKKIKLANKYNEAVDIYNNHIDVYNYLLKDVYEPVAVIQRKLATDITNKLLMGCKDAFHKLLGNPPKLPKTYFKS